MKTIYLARHGETDLNKEDRCQGQSDSSMNSKGIFQAREVAWMMKDKELDVIYHSPLERAAKTAETIAALHPGVELVPEDNIIELDMGEFDGLKYEQILEKYPDVSAKRQADKFNVQVPGGESYQDGIDRTAPFLDELLQSTYKSIMLVGHQGINRCCLGYLLDLDQNTTPHLTIPNNCVYEVQIDGDAREVAHYLEGFRKPGFF